MQLTNKRILVTGASGGIGKALCRSLEQHNAKLIVTCHTQQMLNELKQSLGYTHQYELADISQAQGRELIIEACEQSGGIDGLINLAGIMDFNLFESQSAELISKTLEINTLAPILLCHSLLPQLKSKSESFVLNVGSIFGSIGHPGFTIYCASKAAIKGFSEALARELADTSVCVSYIAPRATNTRLNNNKVNELNKALGNKTDSPEYVAAQIVHVLEKGQSLRYLGWPEKLFVRLNAIFPSIVHKALVGKLKLIKQFANS